MNKDIVKKWDKNKNLLKKHFAEKCEFYRSWESEYEHIVKAVVKYIINDEDDNKYDHYDYKKITVIDDGDYQGCQLFIFPSKTYQPSPNKYLATYQYYGSCSGCDALESIKTESNKELISGLLELSLHLIQNMRFIFKEEN